MNFKYGIVEEQTSSEADRKMSKIAFRDTLVHAFNQGMKNNQEFGSQVLAKWD